MPELPEVEVVKRGLEKAAFGPEKTFLPKIRGWVFHRKDLRDPIPMKKLEVLKGASLQQITRRAKYLLLQTDRGTIVSHLGMTGRWKIYRSEKEVKLEKHSHIELHLDNCVLVFSDPRRFGVLDFVETKALDQSVRFSHLGPEPLEDQFSAEYLLAKIQGKEALIKVLLMDQKIVVGVGNIYASEALFHAQISPLTKGRNLSKQQAKNVVKAIKLILAKAIEKGGSSINDYIQVDGEKGSFQQLHFVYDRKGQDCRKCGAKIKSSVMGGRSTFWCPACQSAKKKN